VDEEDAYKLGNAGENVALKRDGQWLAVERHGSIETYDTLYLELWGTKIGSYEWEIMCSNLNEHKQQGWLIDKFLNKEFAFDLQGQSSIPFSIENNPGSRAPDRFMIVFRGRGKLPREKTTDNIITKIPGIPKREGSLVSLNPKRLAE
jgi:hypothetical protein